MWSFQKVTKNDDFWTNHQEQEQAIWRFSRRSRFCWSCQLSRSWRRHRVGILPPIHMRGSEDSVSSTRRTPSNYYCYYYFLSLFKLTHLPSDHAGRVPPGTTRLRGPALVHPRHRVLGRHRGQGTASGGQARQCGPSLPGCERRTYPASQPEGKRIKPKASGQRSRAPG